VTQTKQARSAGQTGPGAVPLLGTRCSACGVIVYPSQTSCPRCASEDMVDIALSTEGVLWTWTVQRFTPKSPPYRQTGAEFRPFAVGYVEFPEGVRVAGIIDTDDLDRLAIGMRLRSVATSGVPRFAPLPETSGGFAEQREVRM
jgi:uncharacterized OB-fold protein